MKQIVLLLVFALLSISVSAQTFKTFDNLIALQGKTILWASLFLTDKNWKEFGSGEDQGTGTNYKVFTLSDSSASLRFDWYPLAGKVFPITYQESSAHLYKSAIQWLLSHGFNMQDSKKESVNGGYSICITYGKPFDPENTFPAVISITEYYSSPHNTVVEYRYDIL